MPPKELKKVVLVINTSTYFSGLINVARLLKTSNRYKPLIFFNGEYPTIDRDVLICQKEQIECRHRTAEFKRFTWLTRFDKLAATLANVTRIKFCQLLNEQLTDYFFIALWLRRNRPALIVLAGDNVAYNTAAFIRIGHRIDIRTVVIPQWMAGPREAAEFVTKNPEHQLESLSNRLAAKLWPRWRYNHNGKELVRLPARAIIIKELLRLAPPQPWVLHSGQADVIAVESQAMMDYCRTQGLPAKKLVLTGSIDNDLLSQNLPQAGAIKKNLTAQFHLPSDHRLIISPLPPDFLDLPSGRRESEFSDYQEFVRFWTDSLRALPGWSVILSLHPSVSPAEQEKIRSLGLPIFTGPIIDIIPAADLFIGSVSATIQWAILCGRPVLNYDVYRFRYHDYDHAAGVVTIETKKDFLEYLQRFTTDGDYFDTMRKKQQAGQSAWGLLDGQSAQRVLQLFNRLITEPV